MTRKASWREPTQRSTNQTLLEALDAGEQSILSRLSMSSSVRALNASPLTYRGSADAKFEG